MDIIRWLGRKTAPGIFNHSKNDLIQQHSWKYNKFNLIKLIKEKTIIYKTKMVLQ